MKTLFDPSHPFFKGNLHMHSTDSDGRLSPEDALGAYQARGYDFVALTDHWRPSGAGAFMGMTVLSGVELDVQVDLDQVAHIVGIGFDPSRLDASSRGGNASRRGGNAQALIDRIRAAGGVALLAHPAWSMNTPDFLLGLDGLSGAEVFNTYSGIPWNAGRADSAHILDLVAAKGRLLPLAASDDAHHYTGEQGVAATMVNARDASPESLLDAIRAGRFYASQGPSIRQISVEDGLVTVDSSPCQRAVFYSNIQWNNARCVSGKDMTKVSYRLDPRERYIRVELFDSFGRKAWSSLAEV